MWLRSAAILLVAIVVALAGIYSGYIVSIEAFGSLILVLLAVMFGLALVVLKNRSSRRDRT